MPLPLIPIAIGLVGVASGTALHAWLTGGSPDPWEDKNVFNARMRDMQSLAVAINQGFSACSAFKKDAASVTAWRGARDGFSKFYKSVGMLNYMGPSAAEISQAKDYVSKFYFWTGEYHRLKCGADLAPTTQTDPYGGKPPPSNPTDWGAVAKWGAIGVGGAFLLKTLADLFRDYRR